MIEKKLLIFTIIIMSFLTLYTNTTFAGYEPNALVINKITMQCANVYNGEKCTSCILPENWETTKKHECPKDYSFTTIKTTCKPVTSPYCCTIDVEGNGGDCENVVVNTIEEKCAFVKNISKCNFLPDNWEEANENLRRGKICPSLEYEWLEDPLSCIGDEHMQTRTNNSTEPMSNKAKISTVIIVVLLSIITGFFVLK